MDLTYTRSHSHTKPIIAAKATSARTTIASASSTFTLLPGARLVAEPSDTTDHSLAVPAEGTPSGD